MHLLVLLPLQCPAMLCGATHPPGFICLAVFPLKMRYSICQEATTIVFLQKQKKKDDFYYLLYNTSSWHGQQPHKNQHCNKPQSVDLVPKNPALLWISSTLKIIKEHQQESAGIWISRLLPLSCWRFINICEGLGIGREGCFFYKELLSFVVPKPVPDNES